jgi:hypothetical protein
MQFEQKSYIVLMERRCVAASVIATCFVRRIEADVLWQETVSPAFDTCHATE